MPDQPTDPQPVPIQRALHRVMGSVGHVAKADRNAQQGFNFRGIDAVLNAVSPALREHGVTVHPRLESVDYSTAETAKGATMTVCRVMVAYVFTGPAGDTVEAFVPGEAFDSGDKATSKAMSVAFRTALLQALALPTGEPDPDHDVYERAPARPARAARPRKAEQQPEPPELPDPDQVAAWRDLIAAAVTDHDPGPARDDLLRRVWRDVSAAGGQGVLLDTPEGWPGEGEPLRIGSLIERARGVRLEGEPPAEGVEWR